MSPPLEDPLRDGKPWGGRICAIPFFFASLKEPFCESNKTAVFPVTNNLTNLKLVKPIFVTHYLSSFKMDSWGAN
ncbi:hypothetical protein WH95_15485 [Kiloniella litopenaei]|uniref:Uncharacterized protein n=1 Tax=Kiloniella litopenaei TaxID=1549748 RepID=A0A0M2R7G9_9PROT|nr:hypothetical protein WH95_15485 [Kiloniella litopenaei]